MKSAPFFASHSVECGGHSCCTLPAVGTFGGVALCENHLRLRGAEPHDYNNGVVAPLHRRRAIDLAALGRALESKRGA